MNADAKPTIETLTRQLRRRYPGCLEITYYDSTSTWSVHVISPRLGWQNFERRSLRRALLAALEAYIP